MRETDKILIEIENCIDNNIYTPFESDTLELKDLSTGNDWKSLYESICAFLNTKGGIVIIGINENTKQKNYHLTGYNPNNEPNIKQIIHQFKDEHRNNLDISEFVNPQLFEIKK